MRGFATHFFLWRFDYGRDFGFNDQFFDERIEVAMLHLEGNDSKYNKVFNKLSATLSDMFHHYCNGGEGIPEGYEERIQYFLKTYRVLIM